MALGKFEPDNSWGSFLREIESELDSSKQVLKEVALMLDQSQGELSKIIQRNANITGQLQQIQSQMNTMSSDDIRSAYNNALDSQQRMLVMRGQLEKLQTDHGALKKYVSLLEKIQKMIASVSSLIPGGKPNIDGSANSLEMLINAQEAERQRLSRSMHDGPAQALSNFIVQAEITARLFEMDPERAKEELNNLKSAAMSAFQKVRSFISELRPMSLDDLGLVPTLNKYKDLFHEQYGVDVSLSMKGTDRRLEQYLEVMIFRAFQELMSNAVAHNQDQGTRISLNVSLVIDDEIVKVSVADNGIGFDEETIQKTSGLGLKVIKERVELLGGVFDIDSAVGKGCTVTFQLPAIAAKKAEENHSSISA
jgi:two-component system sensor histidine kinase DegS